MSKEEEKKRTEESERTGLGPISRREFAASSVAILGTGPGANLIAAVPQAVSRAGAPAVSTVALAASATAQTIKITVNKHKYELRVEPEWVLRDVLRDHLGWLSIKDMCNGYGACGSCTVIMNGRPVLSCMTFAADCDGTAIETARCRHQQSATHRGLRYESLHAVRLLHARICGNSQGAAGSYPQPDGGRHKGRAGRQHMPVRNLYTTHNRY